MGTSQSKKSILKKDDYKSIYRVKARDTAVMKKVWQIVEYDLSYYSSIFSTVLFRNHPQYIKYFHEDNIPEFVQDARIKKKFSAVCTIVSALFIDYSKKRRQRDHLLGYIAMIHKDMQLSSQDFENFMMNLLEMLVQELPNEMTAECTIVHMRYFSGLLPRIGYFMQLHREKDLELSEQYKQPSKRKLCGLLSLCDSLSIYGRPIEHWIAKKHYWQVRVAFWSSMDMELSGMASFLSTTKLNKHRTSSLVTVNERNPWLKPINHFQTAITSCENVSEDNARKVTEDEILSKNVDNSRSRRISWYERFEKIGKNSGLNSVSPSPVKPMETIPEVYFRGLIAPYVKKSSKTSRAFVDAARTLRDTKIHSETDKNSGDIAAEDGRAIIDTARARKRRRDKRNNVIYPTTGY